MPKLDAPEIPVIPAAAKRYVKIPERDVFDMPFPDIHVNQMKFEHGQQHYLDNELADTVEGRVTAVERANIRLMQPRKDANAEAACRRGVNEGVQTTAF